MRTASAAVLMLIATASWASAQSDPYRWCAQYGGFRSSTSNCYFMTLEQCQATIFGVGGYCRPNPFYTGPESKPRRAKKKRS
jgi:hypothetical protein